MIKISVEKTASRGIVMGKAYVHEVVDLQPSSKMIKKEQAAEEIEKFDLAKEAVIKDLELLAAEHDIFSAHIGIADDITLYEGIVFKIREENLNVELALAQQAAEVVAIFEEMDDEYMKERAADVKDVCNRLMVALKGKNLSSFMNISEPIVLVAKDLFPSDTAKLNLDYIMGFLTQEGGVTSHVSIMAKGLGLPALVGIDGLLSQVKTGDIICMDAQMGEIIVNPDTEMRENYQKKWEAYQKQEEELSKLNSLFAETIDGKKVDICANVGTVEEVEIAVDKKIDGVGLFRSEFLYMENTHFPTEEEQFEVYKRAAQLSSKELTIRTLDIGGDKELSYYEFQKEDNPFLGWRAIRISLELKDLLKTQLRAILRASAFGHIRIMFPMIISIEELREAKSVLEACKKELEEKQIVYDQKIETGMMIETPASVLLIEDFAKEADFFSIGTNDLTQYLLAVDRGNKKIAHLYNSYHPAVLRAIDRIIKAGHAENIKVGMCGEFASDAQAARILLGMGLDEFSMSSGEAVHIKAMIRNTAYDKAKNLAKKVLACHTIQEVMNQAYE